MLTIIEAITERIREQAGEYAEAQARIGARTLAGLTDPLGILAALSAHPPLGRPVAGPNMRPPRPKSRRRLRRSSAVAVKRQRRQSPASNVA